jgi:exodeoxyribonuclease VII large subunit
MQSLPETEQLFSVSELTAAARTVLEGCFASIRAAGEISDLRQPASGHLYFTLKDEHAQIRAVLFRMQRRFLARQPKDGDMVICRGRLSVYAQRGDCQLIADGLEVQGAGSLRLAFEQLKQRLAEEGLFAQERKKPLPSLPEHVTLVTSPAGAAVHDFIRVARRRCPQTRISIWPVTVQGDSAAAELREAVAEINRQAQAGRTDTELIVLCRGGGSFEDLAAFNDERLARVICQSDIPVVSAVGHEIDFTIADFAADLRAPTPSAAAELLLPDSRVLAVQTAELAQRLHQALRSLLAAKQGQLAVAAHRLQQRSPAQTVRLRQEKTAELAQRLAQAGLRLLRSKRQALAHAAGLLEAVSPLAVLARGYAVARKTDGSVITAAEQVRPGEEIALILGRGNVKCVVTDS